MLTAIPKVSIQVCVNDEKTLLCEERRVRRELEIHVVRVPVQKFVNTCIETIYDLF